MHSATRYHDFCAGHRVHGHESKCAHLHGHNYRVHFTVEAEQQAFRGVDLTVELDRVGRVVDFSVINTLLCQWLERNWDHKFLVWDHDPMAAYLADIDPQGVVRVPFNPTAENMGHYLVEIVGPAQLSGYGVRLVSVRIEETRKCSTEYKAAAL